VLDSATCYKFTYDVTYSMHVRMYYRIICKLNYVVLKLLEKFEKKRN